MNLSSVLLRGGGAAGLLALTASVSAFNVQPPPSSARSAAASASGRNFPPTALSMGPMVNVDERAPRNVPAMDEWAAQFGVQRSGGFTLRETEADDWSVFTSEPLPQSSPVLSVPGNMILSSSRTRAELGAGVEEAVSQLGRLGAGEDVAEFYLFLKVLAEYEKGGESPWLPWLDSLPRLYYNAVSMTDVCYELLPPLVFSLARGKRVKFDNFVSALQKANAISPSAKANVPLLKWTFNVVQTRMMDSNGEMLIVPMVDMFNHGTETEIDVTFDENGNCNVYTTREVPAGSPLRRSYGDPTNPSKLFAIYGFLDETSPATFCKIMHIQPTPELVNLGLDPSRMLFYKDSGEVSPEVWDVLLYHHLSSNKQAQRAFYEASMNGDAATKNAIHQQYFRETSTALKNHVDSFIKQLDELSDRAAGRDVNQHPRLPLILRHNEFVRNTFLRVKANLDPMVEQTNQSQAQAVAAELVY